MRLLQFVLSYPAWTLFLIAATVLVVWPSVLSALVTVLAAGIAAYRS